MGTTPPTDRYPDTGFSVKDTPPEVNRFYHERIMALSGERRLLMGMSMLATARSLILSSLPKELSRREKMLALYERLYGHPFPGTLPANY
jgi:hypothetical protein